MCGVAAIYAFRSSAQEVDRVELRTIRDHMAARGPDGKGEWYSNDNRVGLGHRRLAIIDPDERSAQPMVREDGKLAIVLNGEIYNFREIRAGLENRDYRFHTESDTEVLLALYAEKQEAMLNDLRGMFAFVIWDAESKSLFMARDPYGIKPLYYANDGQTLRVASQVKALLAGKGISTAPDPAGIVGFHLFGSVPEPFTIYQNIRQLPAGHSFWVDERGVGEPKAYFSIAETYVEAERASNLDSVDSQEVTRTALLDSVRHHLVSDVPVGAFLSAGIDSGSLVGLMRDAGARDIQTVTLTFDEYEGTEDNEAPLAERVAKQHGTRHITRRVGQVEFEQDLPKILEAMDQPSIDGLNTWFVSKAAAEQGLKVAVSGLGGDELFGGYPSFNDIPRWVRGLRVPGHIPLLGVAVRKIVAPLLGLTNISPKAAGMLELGGSWEGAWLLRRGLFMPWELPALLGEELAREGLQRLQPLALIRHAMQPGPKSSFALVASMESALYMRNQLLRDSDWAGMAHSLEIRVPLVDASLLMDTAGVALGDATWNKQRLAESPNNKLPKEITCRAKTGFTTPVARWRAAHNGNVSPGHSIKTVPSGLRPWARTVYGSPAPKSGNSQAAETSVHV